MLLLKVEQCAILAVDKLRKLNHITRGAGTHYQEKQLFKHNWLSL